MVKKDITQEEQAEYKKNSALYALERQEVEMKRQIESLELEQVKLVKKCIDLGCTWTQVAGALRLASRSYAYSKFTPKISRLLKGSAK